MHLGDGPEARKLTERLEALRRRGYVVACAAAGFSSAEHACRRLNQDLDRVFSTKTASD